MSMIRFSRLRRAGKASAAIALFLLVSSIWQCKFPMSKEPTTLLDVTMVDSLTADKGYIRVLVQVLDTNGTVLNTPFDDPYSPESHGSVLRDIDLGTSPPAVFEIHITGFKANGDSVVFTKKVSEGVANSGWTLVKPADPVSDSLPFISLQPRDLFVWVDSIAGLDVVRRLSANDSLVWLSDDSLTALPLGDGRVKGIAPGQATISAFSFRTPAIRDSIKVHVSRKVDSIASIRLDPPSLTVYTGGASRTVTATILPFNADNLAQFSSLAETFAQVDQGGVIMGLSPGTALIVAHPVGRSEILDSCVVTVKTDKPVIDAGSARKVELGVSVSFPLKVSQEHGDVLALKWDLDGDGNWEDSVLNADTARPAFTYNAARTYKARFQARDTEKNVDSATVTIVAGGNAPLVDITRPGRDTIVNTPKFRLEYSVNSSPRSKEIQLAYGTHKVGASETVAGETGSDSVVITLDTLPPKVKITSPAPNAITRAGTITVSWMVDSVFQSSLPTESLAGRQGPIKIYRESADEAGNRGVDSVTIIRDTLKPVVSITSPVAGEKLATRSITVKWKVDNQDQALETTETLAGGDGPKRIVRKHTDAAGNQDSMEINVILDEFKPGSPVLAAAGTTPSPTRIDSVAWTWSPGGNGNGIYRYTLDTDAEKTTARTSGDFRLLAAGLPDGLHILKVQAGDDQGNWSGNLVHAIAVDRTAPAITITGGDRTVTRDTLTLSATVLESGAGSGIVGPVLLSGGATGTLALSGGKYVLKITLATGLNALTVTAKDSAGNTGTAAANITYTPLPPFKVLVFNRPLGFDHSAAKAAATNLIRSDLPTLLNASPQFTVDTTRDTSLLSSTGLAPYAVLVLNSPSGLGSLNAANKAAILEFANTKGIVAIHGENQTWPEFTALTGMTHSTHPTQMLGTLNKEAPSHWINTGLPATFSSSDEWWAFSPSPAADPDIVTLWSLDESSVSFTGSSWIMGIHPMAWCKALPGGGRFFFTGQGHDPAGYVKTGMFGRLLYNAIIWSAKRD